MTKLERFIKIVNEGDPELRKKLEMEYYQTNIDCWRFLAKHKDNLALARAIVWLR